MSDGEIPVVNSWEKLKEKAEKVGLRLTLRSSVFYFETVGEEFIRYQSTDLTALGIYLAGYYHGRNDEAKSK